MNKKETPRGFFRNLPIRFKLLIVYITVFTLAITAENMVIYSLVRHTIEVNIQSELSNSTSTMVNMVRTTANASIKNYLRAIAEKNRDIVAHIYSQYQAGLLTEEAAKELATGILLSQSIGETGYIYSLNSQGVLEVHPREPLRGADISEYAFVQEQIRRKEGYLEYEWANPGEPAERPKALYMTYFEPWDWIISASSYREEFTTLVNVDDFRNDILSIHFGETGYPYVMDSQGTLVIHPQLEGSNIIDSQDADGRMFIKEISERKTGEIIYPWQNPGEPVPREKLAIFDYIPEFDWIVASSSYLEEFYAPLTAMAKTVTLTVLISLLLVLPLTTWLSATITHPIQQLMAHFGQGAGGDLTVRMQVNSKDEVGKLASYFNNFMGKLETEIRERRQAEEELQRYREHLEELVEARTAELNDMTQEALQAHQAAEAARQTAEQANRAKSTFLANMSHELRTPLNAILGYSQLMGRDPHLTPTQQEYLETIARSGEHLLGLINNVLTMSKIEAGRTTLQENAFDLHRQLHGLQEMFQMRADDKGIGLLLDIAPGVPRYVYADEGKLRQVLMNLLSNAVKFTTEGGVTLRVSNSQQVVDGSQETEDNDYCLLFEVEDTGAGIAPEEIDTLFDPFVQTASGQESQEGTGLGLPISRQFVNLMGGELRAKSKVGQGTTFRVQIPVALADAEAVEVLDLQPQRRVTGIEPGQTGPDGKPFRFLIVEDNPTNRELLLNLLAPFGFDLRCAVNGAVGVELWEQWQPHLVWMDMRMPVMDGYEATRQIKARAKALDRPAIVVALTASAFEEERETILAAGCDDFVRKPFRERDIFNVLHHFLGVRFIYETITPAPQVATSVTLEELRVTSKTLPTGWATDLYQAIVALDNDQMLALIEAIRPQAPALVDTLAQWVRNFEYEKLMALVSPEDFSSEMAKLEEKGDESR